MSSVYGGRLVASLSETTNDHTTILWHSRRKCEHAFVTCARCCVSTTAGGRSPRRVEQGGSRGWQLGELGDGGSVNWATVKTKGKAVCQI